ncbi:MAG TPA: OmpA family protein [Nitrospiria bacterium]
MSLLDVFERGSKEEEEQWISVSDLMAGLMILFLFIAISFMKNIIIEKNKIEEVAVTFQKTQDEIYENLYLEFREDLPKWNATIDKPTLTISFNEPTIYFDSNSSQLKPEFQSILRDFFPRYLKVLGNYKLDIEEVRIEGHTSTEWVTAVTEDEAYFYNMALSQDRTRAVLQYSLTLPEVNKFKAWVKKTITANGMSSSKPILVNGIEKRSQSRRVDFRVKTNAEVQIRKILKVDL